MTVELYWLTRYVGNPPTGQLGDLIVEGYRIPHIELKRPVDPSLDGGPVTVCVDRRFEIDTTEESVKEWGWILANAMAVSAGFSTFNENCTRLDSRFAVGVIDAETGDALTTS